MNKDNPLLFLFEGPIPAEDLAYQPVIDDYCDWLDDPTFSTWLMLSDLAKQANINKVIIPTWWKETGKEFIDEYNQRNDKTMIDFESYMKESGVDIVCRSARERGIQIPKSDEEFDAFYEARLERVRQLWRLEILLEIWREQVRGE